MNSSDAIIENESLEHDASMALKIEVLTHN